MKHTVILILCLFCTLGCKKYKPDYSGGRVTAMKNSKSWEAVAEGFVYSPDSSFVSIRFLTYDRFGTVRETLSFYPIPPYEDSYPVFDRLTGIPFTTDTVRSSLGTFTSEGDVIDGRYDLVPWEGENLLHVIEYDEESGLMRGTFSGRHRRDPENSMDNPDAPEIVTFEEGEFEVFIR